MAAGGASAAGRLHGFTLVELVVVVALLSIAGLVAFQAVRPGDLRRLEVGAEEVAAAMRFARSEALRTGAVHGVEIKGLTNEIDVYRADPNAGNPPFQGTTLTHPIVKRPYAFDLSAVPGAVGVEIEHDAANPPFQYWNLALEQDHVLFDAYGQAFFIKDGVRHPLQDGEVKLGYGDDSVGVDVSLVGRVTVD